MKKLIVALVVILIITTIIVVGCSSSHSRARSEATVSQPPTNAPVPWGRYLGTPDPASPPPSDVLYSIDYGVFGNSYMGRRSTDGQPYPYEWKAISAMRISPHTVMPPHMPPHYISNEEYDEIEEDRFVDALGTPLSTFSIDVDTASYSNVRRFIRDSMMPPPDAVRIEECINYFTYAYPQPTDEHPFSITTEVAICPWNTDHQLVHIGLQGKNVSLDTIPESNLVFLLDVSGSMRSPNKLPLLQQAFRLLVKQLGEKDNVSIVVYAGSAGIVLQPTSGDNQETILQAIDNLRAGGSTAGGEGIQMAYALAKENFLVEGNNRVILATDGDFNVGISDNAELVELIESKRDEGIYLTILGFGMGNYKDSKMEQLADKGNGNYSYIDNIREAKKVLVNELAGTLLTIAKDVKIQVEFNPAKVKAYRLIGYENRKLAKEDFVDDTKDAGELGSGHSVTALYEIIPVNSDEALPIGDDLKYQEAIISPDAFTTNEMMNVKLRYKLPDSDQSILVVHPVLDDVTTTADASDNFRFAAAVAEFGLLLRDSPFRGEATYMQALQLAKSAKGQDEEGYRAEFIQLVEMVELKQITQR